MGFHKIGKNGNPYVILGIDKRCHTIPNLERKLRESVDDFILLAVQALHRMYMQGDIKESQISKDNSFMPMMSTYQSELPFD